MKQQQLLLLQALNMGSNSDRWAEVDIWERVNMLESFFSLS